MIVTHEDKVTHTRPPLLPHAAAPKPSRAPLHCHSVPSSLNTVMTADAIAGRCTNSLLWRAGGTTGDPFGEITCMLLHQQELVTPVFSPSLLSLLLPWLLFRAAGACTPGQHLLPLHIAGKSGVSRGHDVELQYVIPSQGVTR